MDGRFQLQPTSLHGSDKRPVCSLPAEIVEARRVAEKFQGVATDKCQNARHDLRRELSLACRPAKGCVEKILSTASSSLPKMLKTLSDPAGCNPERRVSCKT